MQPSQSAGCERRARRAGGLHLTRVEPSRPRPSAPAAQPLCISVYARSAILPAIVHSAPSALTSAAERGRLGSGRVRTAKAFLSFRPRNTAPIFVAASSCVMPWFHVSVVWPSSWAASICAAVIVVGGSLCADSQNSPSMGSGSPSSQVFCTGRDWVMARGWPVGNGRAGGGRGRRPRAQARAGASAPANARRRWRRAPGAGSEDTHAVPAQDLRGRLLLRRHLGPELVLALGHRGPPELRQY